MIPVAKPFLAKEEADAAHKVILSGNLAQGPEVAAFESEFAKALTPGCEAVALNSGTSALHMAFLAAGVAPGDEIIVPSFSFAATANAVALSGATPVFVDIDPDTFNISAKALEAAITPRTRGVMPVHLYGHPADMPSIEAITKRYGLILFEDAAQAHGAAIADRPVGTWGIASFSFYPTKNMTSGEGGMVTTSDTQIARKIRILRNQGMESRYANELIGFNTRMSDIHASIGRVQLGRLSEQTAKRQANAAFLSRNLEGVVVPKVKDNAVHVWHQYTVRLIGHDRDDFAAALARHGVGSGVYYPTPIHRLPSFGLDLDLPETARAAREVLSLPVYPSLSEKELETIVGAVNAVANAGA